MADATTIIPAVVALIIGLVGGGGIIRLYEVRKQSNREQRRDIWDSFKEQIESANERGDAAEVDRLRREYEAQEEAWRAQQGLKDLAPGQVNAAQRHAILPKEEASRLNSLLKRAETVSPALLTADDYRVLGNAFYAAERYREASNAFHHALRLKPEDSHTLLGLAAALSSIADAQARPAEHRHVEISDSGRSEEHVARESAEEYIKVESAVVRPDEATSVALVLNSPAVAVGAYTIDVKYDPAFLHASSCSPTGGGVCNPEFAPDTVRFTGASATGFRGRVELGHIQLKARDVETRARLEVLVQVVVDATPGSPQDIVGRFVTRDGYIEIRKTD